MFHQKEGRPSNGQVALDVIRARGWAVHKTTVDTFRLVGAQSRRRVYFFCLHIKRYLEAMNIQYDDEGAARYHCEALTQKACYRLEEIQSMELPVMHLDQFLFDEGDERLNLVKDKIINKNAASSAQPETAENPAKRGRTGVGWKKLHEQAYSKELKQPYTDPATRDHAYRSNQNYMAIPPREQDIILFWDKVTPIDVLSEREEEICPSLC